MPRASARAATRRARRARDAVRDLCARHGLRVSGPNCMGSVALRERLLLYPAARVRALPVGAVGVVFQSGGTFQFWLQQAATRGLGFSYAVSSGNELDLDLADYINFLVEDEAHAASSPAWSRACAGPRPSWPPPRRRSPRRSRSSS